MLNVSALFVLSYKEQSDKGCFFHLTYIPLRGIKEMDRNE